MLRILASRPSCFPGPTGNPAAVSNGDVQQRALGHRSTGRRRRVTHAGEGFSFWAKRRSEAALESSRVFRTRAARERRARGPVSVLSSAYRPPPPGW